MKTGMTIDFVHQISCQSCTRSAVWITGKPAEDSPPPHGWKPVLGGYVCAGCAK